MKMAVILTLLNAASAPAIEPGQQSSWFAGDWGQVPGPHGDSCAAGTYATYRADGTYRFVGERGRWSLDGDRLTETATAVDEQHNWRPASDVGQAFVSTIRRVAEDRYVKTYFNGLQVEFARCRNPAPPRADRLR